MEGDPSGGPAFDPAGSFVHAGEDPVQARDHHVISGLKGLHELEAFLATVPADLRAGPGVAEDGALTEALLTFIVEACLDLVSLLLDREDPRMGTGADIAVDGVAAAGWRAGSEARLDLVAQARLRQFPDQRVAHDGGSMWRPPLL